ncbi:hypothetical protein [Nostoc sp. ChiQUE01b]|uniref:hypothetical protein n=1 Tax=Nostoc sp. ChiQUE01b TaxID=3075376 RepID=UPI002AD49B49|nr:hypothetical protein [Nostoc sp. ChiQUE01b]MDZ8264450.1 hypothetical protein [Nostoc sp. ChiQUE01b]
MTRSDELVSILDRILDGCGDEGDVAILRQSLKASSGQNVVQLGKYNVSIGEGKDIHIGDKVYQGADAQTIRSIFQEVLSQNTRQLEIDWHNISKARLSKQQLTTNPLTQRKITYQTEQVYVPLGLVERKEPPVRCEDVSPEQGSELYSETKITQKFEHQQFLEQVLRDRQSPKSQGRRIAIIGEPGAGKTTLLQQIAQWVLAEMGQSVVIWVSLADLRSRELESYLLEVWLQAVTEDQQKKLNAKLGELAKEAIDKEGFRLREEFVIKYLDDPNKENSPFFIARKLGWLNNVGVDDKNKPVYAFFHPTFEEYFAVCSINDWKFFLDHNQQNPRLGTYRVFDSKWKEPILLWLGQKTIFQESQEDSKKLKETFIEALISFKDGWQGYYQYQSYFLAVTGIAELQNFDANQIIQKLLEWSLLPISDKLLPIIEGAKIALRDSVHQEDAIYKTIALINSINEIDKSDYLEKESRGVTWIVKRRVYFEKPNPKYWLAVSILGEVGVAHSKAITKLSDIITKSQHPFTRLIAAESLGRIDDSTSNLQKVEDIRREADGSLKEIEEILQTSNEAKAILYEGQRTEGTYQLIPEIDSNDPQAIEKLIKRINTTKDEYFARSTKPRGVIRIHTLVPNEGGYIRLEAARRIGKINPKSKEVVDTLINIIKTTVNEDARQRAIKDLEEFGFDNSDAIQVLANIIKTTKDKKTLITSAKSLAIISPGNHLALTNLFKVGEYETLYSFAQAVPYPDFHRAWQQSSMINRLMCLSNMGKLLDFLSNLLKSFPRHRV